jgi:hypothetical protein
MMCKAGRAVFVVNPVPRLRRSFALPGIPALQLPGEPGSGAGDEISQAARADAIPAERDCGLLLEEVTSGNRDRIEFSIFCDESLDDIIRCVRGVRIENLDAAGLNFLGDNGPSSVEYHYDVGPALVLVFR